MEPTQAGEAALVPGRLVKVADGGSVRDGIVFDKPSRSKVVVAVVDSGRGPVYRTVHPKSLTERTEEGADDAALRLLIRRTPPPVRGADAGGVGVGHRRAGHARGSMHRTTGK
jgi:hypothetical protein